MNLEHHVTSLELSRKLKELGVPQEESHFVWNVIEGHATVQNFKSIQAEEECSAFLASELGEMLPKEVDGFAWRQLKTPTKGSWEIKYRKREQGIFHPVILHQISDSSEPNARARMLIWLIQARLADPRKLAA